MGPQFLPLPIGDVPYASLSEPKLNCEKIDAALRGLGGLLKNDALGKTARDSYLAFGEELLDVRSENTNLPEDILELPLIRARRFPDDDAEAWSLRTLRKNETDMVFSRPCNRLVIPMIRT